MNFSFPLDEIIYRNAQPWLESNNIQEKFATEIIELQTTELLFTPIYELKFERHIDDKTKYYKKLIQNQKNEIINNAIFKIDNSKHLQQKKYWIHKLLQKIIPSRIIEIGAIINSKKLDLQNIILSTDAYLQNQHLRADTYVIQYLKESLIHMYLEIQEYVKEFIEEEDIMIEQDFYTQWLHIPFSTKSYFYKIPVVTQSKQTNSETEIKKEATIEKKLEPREYDFRPGYSGKLTFNEIRNKTSFNLFENNLYQEGIIDENFNFTNKHGAKKILAALFNILIDKNYFKEKNRLHLKKFTRANYRQYLDHRYNVNTSQEFRKTQTEYIDDIQTKIYWISKIPHCN